MRIEVRRRGFGFDLDRHQAHRSGATLLVGLAVQERLNAGGRRDGFASVPFVPRQPPYGTFPFWDGLTGASSGRATLRPSLPHERPAYADSLVRGFALGWGQGQRRLPIYCL